MDISYYRKIVREYDEFIKKLSDIGLNIVLDYWSETGEYSRVETKKHELIFIYKNAEDLIRLSGVFFKGLGFKK